MKKFKFFTKAIKFNIIHRQSLISVLAFALIFTLVLSLCACDEKKKEMPQTAFETSYDLIMDFSDDMQTVEISEEIMYTNTTNKRLNEIVLHLFANAYSETAVSNELADKQGDAKITSERESSMKAFMENMKDGDFGGIKIHSAKIDRQAIDYIISGEDSTILSLPTSLDKGKTCTIDIQSTLTIPNCDARLGNNGQSINLTSFYPVLAVYDGDGWHKDIFCHMGDPFFSEIASYYVTCNLPNSYKVATSGEIEEITFIEQNQNLEISAEKIRDFAMVFSQNFEIKSGIVELESHSVKVDYYYIDDEQADSTLSLCTDVIKTFSQNFGDYPYPHYSVVQSPLNAGGMEHGALVIVAPCIKPQNYVDVIVHETAHQWWYGVVGSNQLENAWLDEGLTEFCTAYYHKLKGDYSLYNQMIGSFTTSYQVFSQMPKEIGFNSKMDRHLSTFLTEDEYVAVVYCKGALMYETLRQIISDKKLNTALATYFNQNKFKIADIDCLITAFEENDILVGRIIQDWVSGEAIV